MITEIIIENFKPFGKPQTIPLKPITLLYGPNSSGKSSIIQFLLMVKQTLENKGSDALVSQGDHIELGDYNNIVHKHKVENKLGFGIACRMRMSDWNRGSINQAMDSVRHTDFIEGCDLNINDFRLKCSFQSSSGIPEISSIQYYNHQDCKPLLQFDNTKTVKEIMFKTNPIVIRFGIESKGNENNIIPEYASFDKDVMFSLFDFVNSDHPLFKMIFNAISNNINSILIPIEGNIQRIFGKKLNLNAAKQMSMEKFIAFALKGIRKPIKTAFIEELKTFYKKEVNGLLNNYIRFKSYSYEVFLKDLKECYGRAGLVNINKFFFDEAFDEGKLAQMTGASMDGDRVLRISVDGDVCRSRLGVVNNLESIIDEIDPMQMFCGELDDYRQMVSGEYNDWMEESYTPDEGEIIKLEAIVKKLKKTSGEFSDGLDSNRINAHAIQKWFKNWGHLGSEKYFPIKLHCVSDIKRFAFSKHYESVTDYVKYIDKKYLRINLREFVKNISYLIEDYFTSIVNIAPIRALPERHYFSIEIERFKKNRNDTYRASGKESPFELFKSPIIEAKLNSVFNLLGVEYEVKIKRDEMNKKPGVAFSLELIDKNIGTLVNIKDIGQGISQIIPIIIEAIKPYKSTLLIQQPEVHIHPRLQAELGTFFAKCIEKEEPMAEFRQGKNFIIETHSEALMMRFQKLIREKMLSPDDLAVIYVEKDGGESKCKELRMDENGDFIDDWPDGFFEEGYREMFQ